MSDLGFHRFSVPDLPGIDQELHLHTLGGPLHEAPATHCAGCRRPIPEHGYHVIDEDVYCQSCGALAATETLIDSDPLHPLDAVETQALDILRQFVHEQETRGRHG